MKHTLNPKHHAKRAIQISLQVKHVLKDRLSIAKKFHYNIDSPRKRLLDKRKIQVEGWIIPKRDEKFEIRVRNNKKIFPVKIDLKRLDVAKTHPKIKEALKSGFSSEFEFEDGSLVVEVNIGKGFKALYKTKVAFGLGDLPKDIYNKEFSNNYPEHLNLIENRQIMYYEEEYEKDYLRNESDPRIMAIYLPQFHPFAENDKAWGKGFTEWSNVTTGQPRFIGHQQPVLPRDLGFYDLRLEAKIKEQIDLAKKYGVYGFTFYYYWFSGKKIMGKPLKSFMNHTEWDFNFSICWANENWTKRWDGRDSEIIIEQAYREEDPLLFIKDVEYILLDKRYITENGKPILTVYRASELKDPKRYAEVWREYFRNKHNKELQLVSCLSFDDQDPREYGFDAALDFSPLSAFFKAELFPDRTFPYIDVNHRLLDINFSGVVADYRSIALRKELFNAYNFPTYYCVSPSWDNDARKKGKGFVYQNSSPDLYARWLKNTLDLAATQKTSPIIFINAWNEWAEGAMMEPSTHLGHSILKRTVESLSLYSKTNENKKNFPEYGFTKTPGIKLAVVVHLFYVELWPIIASKLERISQPFDLHITLNKANSNFDPKLEGVRVKKYTIPNRGRDVLPFLYVIQRIRAAGYTQFLKIHSKKSKHRKDGEEWLESILENLLPGSAYVTQITNILNNGSTGLIGPEDHLVSLKKHMGSNRAIIESLLTGMYDKKTANKVISTPQQYPFFGGTMFWGRVDVLSPILDMFLLADDFQSEHNQIDGTTAHAVERLFGIVVWLEKRKLYQSNRNGLYEIKNSDYDTKYKFAS